MYLEEELKHLSTEIRHTEIRLQTIRIDIISVNNEIEIVELLEKSLIQNIALLKKKKIITLASEFKKSKFDLIQARERIVLLKSKRKEEIAKHREALKILELFNKKYQELANPKNNVIELRLGRNNEQR